MRQVMIQRGVQFFGLALALLTSANVATCIARGDEPKSQTFPPGVPQLPFTGTPVGLPGPPHIPLGSPAGSQYPSAAAGGFRWTSNQQSDEAISRYQDAKRSRVLNDLQLQELHRQARASLKATMVREHRIRVQRVKLARERLDVVEKQLKHRFDNLDLLVDNELAKRFNNPVDVAKAVQDEARHENELRTEMMKLFIEALVELDTDVATSEQLQNGLPASDPRREASMTRTQRLRGLGNTLRGKIKSLKTVDLQGATWAPSGAVEVVAPKAAANQLPDELDIRWEFKADEAIEATPAVGDGSVFVADALGQIYAIDKADGKELWRHNYNTGFLASPALQGNLLVIGDVDGNLYAIEADTGKQRWAASTDGQISAAASFHNDNVLVTSQDGKLYCFSIADGSAVWSYETDDQIRCSPTVIGDRTFLGGCDGSLHVVDLYTGKAIGQPLPLGGPTGSTPVVRDSKVFLPIMDGAVLSLDWVEDKEIWRYEDQEQLQEYRSDAAVSDKMVIVSSQSKQVDAISIKTGQLMWRHTLRRRADASPVIAGDEVWIAATDGRLIRLSLENGREEKPSYEIRGSFLAAPVIAGGQLFVADDKGVVRCFSKQRPITAVRHFVCLVVDADRITFEGQTTTWETLPKLLEKVPNRPFTVFEFAFASDDLSKRQKSEVIARCVSINEQFGFEYPSYTGIKPLGSKGSPSQDSTKQEARARY